MRSNSYNRRGFSLIEALTAAVIVTVSGAAMLLAVGQALQQSNTGIDTTRAIQLARELMTEISASRWTDADYPNHWGLEDGEPSGSTRLGFDDLDDYDGWSGPPQTKSGTRYDSWQSSNFKTVSSHPYAHYVCAVHVTPVSQSGEPLAANQTSSYRRVTVEVTHQGLPGHRVSRTFFDVATLVGCNHWFDPTCTDSVAVAEIVP